MKGHLVGHLSPCIEHQSLSPFLCLDIPLASQTNATGSAVDQPAIAGMADQVVIFTLVYWGGRCNALACCAGQGGGNILDICHLSKNLKKNQRVIS